MRALVVVTVALPLLAGSAVVIHSEPAFRIGEVRAVLFDADRGQWSDTNLLVQPQPPLWNRIAVAILFTVQVTGPDLHRKNREHLRFLVRGTKVDVLEDYPLAEVLRLPGAWIPIVVYPLGCTPVSFQASIVAADGSVGTVRRDTLHFECGE